jgi:hypothetical protein
MQRPDPRSKIALQPLSFGLFAASLVVVGIVFGSRTFKDFDTALVPYAAATVFATFATGYRFAVWLRRPPTYRYFRQTISLFFTRKNFISNVVYFVRSSGSALVTQRFIRERSTLRWLSHLFIMWGCLLAAAVTFPLSFGWIRFETPMDSQEYYEAFVFGVRVVRYRLDSVLASLTFNILVISAVMVIVGIFLAIYRRGRDRGVLAVQDTFADLLPLILLFAISATGLLLTVSAQFLHGFHYAFLSQLHAIIVVLTLLYIPFGKFFHIVQRPAQLGIHLYRHVGATGEQAKCTRCGEAFASAMQVADLKVVQAELGIKYNLAGGKHYQDVCPACRRKNLALLQDGLVRASRTSHGEQ